MKKTKIVATIGPACESAIQIEKLILSGVNVFRFNTKHNEISWHEEKIRLVKKVSQRIKMPVGIFIDLQGPEIRIGNFPSGKINLVSGEKVCLSPICQGKQKTIIMDKKKDL